MEGEILELLKKNLALNEANNKMLISMRRQAWLGTIVKIVYWIVILGGIGFTYLYIEPYLNTVLNAYNDMSGSIGEIRQQASKLNDLGGVLQRATATPY